MKWIFLFTICQTPLVFNEKCQNVVECELTSDGASVLMMFLSFNFTFSATEKRK